MLRPGRAPSVQPDAEPHKAALEQALEEIGAERQQAKDEELTERLSRLPDPGKALRNAPPEVKGPVVEVFDLPIGYDKPNRRVEVSATLSDAVAGAPADRQDPPRGGP